jgi:glucose/arabinose dehydrogenase
MKRLLLTSAIAAAFALAIPPASAGPQDPYAVSGTCGGLPKVTLHTAPGFCVGLVATGLKFPRGVLPLKDGTVLVAEMIGWGAKSGRITALVPDGKGRYAKKQILKGLKEPHGLALGPDGKIYVGVVGGVKRFALNDPEKTVEDVVGGTATVKGPPGDGRHPLVSLLFTKRKTLLLNVGSVSDNCEHANGDLPAPDQICPETRAPAGHGLVREYEFDWETGKAKGWTVFAEGMRNSMALAEYPESGLILEAENSRDSINDVMPELSDDEELPPDELNVLVAGGRYGWPYCYGANIPSPEYQHWNCTGYHPPVIALPAHSAPLGLAYWNGGLAVGYHGYRKHGHRIVWFPIAGDGTPQNQPKELVFDWEGKPDGAPTDLKAGADGALYVTEDHNGTVLRLVAE